MLRRSWAWLTASQRHQSGARRSWETAVARALGRSEDKGKDWLLDQHKRVYEQKGFVRVEDAFPLSDKNRWADVSLSKRVKPPSPRVGEQRFVTRVAIVGPPNAGKSSLLNALTTSHVSAESMKEGTTKTWVKGVATVHNTQLVMLDTPGIFHLKKESDKERHLHHTFAAWDALMTADVCVVVLPVGLGFLRKETKAALKEVLMKAGTREMPCVLALTKIDTVRGATGEYLYKELRAEIDGAFGSQFAKIVEVSSSTFRGMLALKDLLCLYGKEGEWRYFPQQETDMTPPERCGEILSELVFKHMPAYITHTVTHKVIGWTEKDRELLIDIEMHFDRPAFMSVFFSKQYAIRKELTKELAPVVKKKVKVVFHTFVAPSSIKS